MKYSVLFTLLFTCAITLNSQSLVFNPYFSQVEKKVKGKGMIELADGWYSATNAPVNLYASGAKSDLVKVPDNEYGSEKPKEGENYVGLVLYSYRERSPRTYLSSRLTKPMEKGEHYCVKMHVSLADLAKYSCDNIGIYLTEDSVYQEGEGIIKASPQVMHSRNRIFDKQWDWEPICRIYVAKGGEEYITIGNFEEQAKVLFNKVKKSREYTQPQLNEAYYYVDAISVTPGGTPANCKCEEGNFAFAHLEMEEKNFGSNPDEAPKTTFISSTGRVTGDTEAKPKKETIIVPFDLAKASVTEKAKSRMDDAIKFLKENKDAKIEVVAHIDQSEVRITELGQKRMNEVRKYIISQGISEDRLNASNVRESEPLDDSGIRENREKNTVVEIKFD